MERKEPIDFNSTYQIQDAACRKRKIRKEVLSLRNNMSPEEQRAASLKIADRLIGHQWFYGSEILLIFTSFGSEIDTTEIINEALRMGKRVYVPRVEGEEMQFYRILSLKELSPGYKGIMEPDGFSERYEYCPETMKSTLMIMPGVAFDPLKNRIGYGKGFYDRYLSDKAALVQRTVAIGFQCQLVEEIPFEERDIKPCQVILG